MNRGNKSKSLQLVTAALLMVSPLVVWAGGVKEPRQQASVEQGMYELRSAGGVTFALDISSCTERSEEEKAGDGALGQLQLYEAMDVNQQKFYLEKQSDGSFAVFSVSEGLYLTAGEEAQTAQGQREQAALLKECQEIRKQEEELQTEVREIGTAGEEFAEAETEVQPGRELASKNPAEALSEAEAAQKKAWLQKEARLSKAGIPTERTDVDPAQRWMLMDAGDGSVYIRSEAGLYLTCGTEYARYRSAVLLQEFEGWQDQKWYLVETRASQTMHADTDVYNDFADKGRLSDMKLRFRYDRDLIETDSDTVASWNISTEKHGYQLSEEKIREYVEKLAQNYDTQGCPRTFVTHGGSAITLFKGNFGWKTNVEETTALVKNALEEGKTVIIKPVWEHEGNSFEKGNDVGDSYVEISLEDQKLWLYVDGKEILETDVVTGTYGTDRQTPGGVYSLTYKQSPAVLRGADYESPVTYWMPFNGNIGMHDANWRSQFGGDIFRSDGSHGCVNLPTEAAKTIYETVQKGFPVVLYN
ncbi:MAG: L,D-transpeptidase family protein [Lachnospiraceae bacterium]|nr:L,D-transpeptidase family protein [Lachnospiraceae bacterium]